MLDQYIQQHTDAPHAEAVKASTARLQKATMWLMQNGMQDREQAGAAATPYLRLMALTMMAYFWSRMAMTAQQALDNGSTETDFYQAKLFSADFFFAKLLPQAEALMADIESGKDSVMAMTADMM